jgi:hypothetical protein
MRDAEADHTRVQLTARKAHNKAQASMITRVE